MHRMIRDTVEEFWTWDDIEKSLDNVSDASVENFSGHLSSFLGVNKRKLFLTSSGRMALFSILKSLTEFGKTEVLVPAFNCNVVGAAISRAGFRVKAYDFTAENGRLDFQQIDSMLDDSVGVVIISHFFGVPVDFTPIIESCRRKKIIIIEDCAHALGAKIGGSMAGTLGDASIFSFNYDKPISLGWGGALLINNESLIARFAVDESRSLSAKEEYIQLRKFSNAINLRRKDIVKNRGGRFLAKVCRRIGVCGDVKYTPLGVGVGSLRAELGIQQLASYDAIIKKRNINAKIISDNTEHSQKWWVEDSVIPAFVKQKVILSNFQTVSIISSFLQKHGVRVGNFNWPRLIVPENDLFPNASAISERGLDVAIHQNMTSYDLELIINTLNKYK